MGNYEEIKVSRPEKSLQNFQGGAFRRRFWRIIMKTRQNYGRTFAPTFTFWV